MTRNGLKLLLSFAALLLFGVESPRAQVPIGPQGPEEGVIRGQNWLIPAQDRITLMRARVFRPAGAGPFPLAVIAHGSTQNEIRRAEFRAPQYPALTEWLVARGYAVAVPQRPGHGETGGPYYEAQGGCANADYARAGQGAASSIAAAIDFLSRQAFVKKSGAVALGHSAGGWGVLSLTTHALRPLAGVVAFAPRLGGRADDVAGKNCAPDRLVAASRTFGEKARVPALWLYAKNESYFSPALSKRMADAFRAGGGRGAYELLPAVGSDGHELVFAPATGWGAALERFLRSLR
ncbi:MAG: alpha/beta fold hydrolase [Xanthobacteraceae bacterium]|nr:alpha/beta fold hydrolase [Xanthobacteraceae bacterium]